MCKECGGTCGGKVSGMGKKGKIRGFSGGRLMRNAFNVGGAYAANKVAGMIQSYEMVQSNSLLANGLILAGALAFGDKAAVMIDNFSKSDAGTVFVANVAASCIDPFIEAVGVNGIESEPDWANQYGYYTGEHNTESGGSFRVDA